MFRQSPPSVLSDIETILNPVLLKNSPELDFFNRFGDLPVRPIFPG